MPSERKRWIRCPESVAFQPGLGDDDRLLATWYRLLAYMNRRWARDGISPREGERIVLSRSALHQITGRSQRRHQLATLRALAEHAECTLSARGELVEIYWPNLAEFLWSESERRSRAGPPYSEERRREESPKKSKDRANSAEEEAQESLDELLGSFEVIPDRLSPEDRKAFAAWLHRSYPPLWTHRLRLERQCLEHYRRHPARARETRSWLARVKAYAQVAWEREHQQAGLWPTSLRSRGQDA